MTNNCIVKLLQLMDKEIVQLKREKKLKKYREIRVRSGQSSARILACTTGVIGTLIGVFETTR